jgi:mannose-6-phosphate isomerase
MKPVPARLEPRFVERIWGARSLAPLFPEKENLPEPIGEVWLTGNDCAFANGPWAGQKLAAAWRAMPIEWTGAAMNPQAPFPLLIKFLFPAQWLSVQVHPDDAYAQKNEAAAGGVGKTEMWHALTAEPGASVRVGLHPAVTAAQFRQKITDGTVEECMARIPVAAGDNIFVPAGTVHTIGPGLVLCEIQENSDITYRVFDYNRSGPDGKRRALHVEQALAVTRFGEQRGGKTEPIRSERSGRTVTQLAACPYFAAEKWEVHGRVNRATAPDRFELFIILEGHGRIEMPAEPPLDYARGQAWLLPAALGAFQLVPGCPTALLRVFVPNLTVIEQRFPQGPPPRLVFR